MASPRDSTSLPRRPAPRRPARRRRLWSTLLDVVLFGLALWVLHKVLTQYRYSDVLAALGEIGWPAILGALGLTILGYAALIGYDYLSLRLVGHPRPVRQMWLPSFISFAVSNSAPVAILTGGGLRVRLFAGLGLTAGETAAVAAGNVLTYVLGLLTVAGIAFLVTPLPLPASLPLPFHTVRPLGPFFLAGVALVLIAGRLQLGSIGIGRWRFAIPPLRTLLAQLGISAADWLLSSGALYVLLRSATNGPYLPFLTAFLLAQLVTQVVPLPGGIGVFEAVILVLRPPGAEAPAVTGALLLYRVIYYLLPLLAAAALLVREARRGPAGRLPEPLRRVAGVLAPHLFAVITFVAGGVLLAFGAVPPDTARLTWLARILPLAVIESSHFLGSIVGTGLILLAWGLERRLRAAWRLTLALLVLGVPLALLRGLDFASAVLLAALFLVLVPARDVFRRRSALTREPLTAGWLAAVGLGLVSLTWLAVFAHRHADLTGQPWWRITLFGRGIPRPLRAGVGVMTTLLLVAFVRLFRRPRRRQPGSSSSR